MAPVANALITDECESMQVHDSIHFYTSRLTMHQFGWGVCAVAALIATTISFITIYRHAINYNKPSQQRYIIRILFFTPIYAISTLFSYLFYRKAFYIEAMGDLYEAILMGSFFILLCNYLSDASAKSVEESAIKESITDTTCRPFLSQFCFQPKSPKFLDITKIMVLQYVAIKPVAAIIAATTHHFNLLCPGSLAPYYANLWINIINGASMLVAMQGLLSIYYAIRIKIRFHDPNVQFFSVKMAVFLVTIQKLFLAILVHFNVFSFTNHWSAVDIARGVNAVMINVELIALALVHLYAFDHYKYISHTTNICPISSKIQKLKLSTPSWRIFRDALNPWEILLELCHAISAIFHNNAREDYLITMQGNLSIVYRHS
ncbi:organic solute transporter Ostalpha-domain-containing protein [Syncephalis fuscata]|nr:organic solute transporter Ostalpha-domain-containing protein [Syncephalis fuscata]